MKVRVTKVMAKVIAKAMKEREMRFEEVSVVTMSERSYVLNVCGMFDLHEAQEYDYDWYAEVYKVIKVVWPWDYHACPTYLTTKRLMEILRMSDKRDLDTFMDNLCNEIAI